MVKIEIEFSDDWLKMAQKSLDFLNSVLVAKQQQPIPDLQTWFKRIIANAVANEMAITEMYNAKSDGSK